MRKLRTVVGVLNLITFIFWMGCSESGLVTAPPAPILGDVTTSAFILGGPFPADIDIVDEAGLEDVAFITTTSPAAILAIDLNSNPLALSSAFKGLPSLPALASSGIPNNLVVVDSTHAFLLTSDSLIYFNPTDASVYQTLSLTTSLTPLLAPLTQIKGDGSPDGTVSGSFTPSFPASLAVSGSKLAISFSNLFYAADFSIDHVVQGVVRFYDIHPTSVTPAAPAYVATSRFNATGLTPLANGNFLVTNTGVTRFEGVGQVPVTPASVDVISPSSNSLVATLDLGLVAPAFRSWAITPDVKKAFLGSSSGGYVIEIGLDPLSLIQGLSDPIIITSGQNGSDFIDDVVMGRQGGGLYTASFNQSSVYAIDLTGSEATLLPDVVNLAFPGNPGGVTGAGPMALRPGTPGVDFTGPDLFVLTGNPGTLAAIKTY